MVKQTLGETEATEEEEEEEEASMGGYHRQFQPIIISIKKVPTAIMMPAPIRRKTTCKKVRVKRYSVDLK